MKFLAVFFLPIWPVLPYQLAGPTSWAMTMPTFEIQESSRSSPAAPADSNRRAPSLFESRAVRERARNWEALALETPGWKLLMTDSFAVRSDAPLEEIRLAGVYLEEFLKTHRRVLGGDPSGIRFSARMFRDERAFRIYAQCRGAPDAASFYDPSNSEVVIYLPMPKDRYVLGSALMHEFSHQYLHRVFDRLHPTWFVEGLAEYFGAYSVVNDRVEPGADVPGHRERLRQAWVGKRFIALAVLRSMDREAFYRKNGLLPYAEAWSFVRWLAQQGPPASPDLIGTLLRRGAVEDAISWEAAEQEWMRTLGLK